MGGRVAEEIIFGDDKVTSGASSDIEQATQRARNMVMQAGTEQRTWVLLLMEKMKKKFFR